MELDRAAIVQTFLLEAEENLALAEDASIALESRPDDEDLVQALFRAVHTVKGGADSLGFGEITSLSHAVEDLLGDVRGGRLAAGTWLVTLLLESFDALRTAIGDVRETGSAPIDQLPAMVLRLQEARARAAEPAEAVSQVPLWQAAPGPLRHKGTLRVEVEKLDAALSTTGELGVALGRLDALFPVTGGVRSMEILDARVEVQRLQRELEDHVMSLRMVPVGPMLRGFVRTVRDVATLHDKQARLVIEGAEVTVDANVIEQLRGPMTHVVRNAIDHGIERPDQRRARGKDPCGRIVVRARRDAGAVVLQIEDDGMGLRRDRIAARARALGLLAEPERASDAELFALVFAPGFSTAERLTDLSGRGVGLDAVKRAVELLRGTSAISSPAGAGTTVTLRLPVTLALLDGFSVGLDDDVFVLPRESVVECVALPAPLGDGAALLDVRGRALPVVRLRDLFGRGHGRGGESLVVLDCDGSRIGLAVEHLYGEAKTVIRPMSAVFRDVRAVAGCSVLGSGRVALVLDVAGLFEEALRRRAGRPAAAGVGLS